MENPRRSSDGVGNDLSASTYSKQHYEAVPGLKTSDTNIIIWHFRTARMVLSRPHTRMCVCVCVCVCEECFVNSEDHGGTHLEPLLSLKTLLSIPKHLPRFKQRIYRWAFGTKVVCTLGAARHRKSTGTPSLASPTWRDLSPSGPVLLQGCRKKASLLHPKLFVHVVNFDV